ncbi:MAG: hypothetical protein ACTSXX_14940 [Candidatus Baldrarchaeia archaeon]
MDGVVEFFLMAVTFFLFGYDAVDFNANYGHAVGEEGVEGDF